MMFKKEELEKLRGKVKNIDDLRRLAKEHGYRFTETELITAYNIINGELSIDDLKDVSGGQKDLMTFANTKRRGC